VRYIVAAAGCGLAVVAVIVLTIVLSENVVYFRTVSEALSDRKEQGTDRFRLAGAVVPGSIEETANGVTFALTDGKKTVDVVHRGDPPELFKKNAPVVCEGRWAAATVGAPFDSDRIMIKHGSEYAPPKVDTKDAPAPERRTA
jgi:cytochrome c-type biogenesis protein CcmE